MSASGWIGVDLDGTLARYDEWRGIEHVGEPVERMAFRVRKWLSDGVDVRIFTARVSGNAEDAELAAAPVRAWCVEHFGVELPITCRKDFAMIELYDDRCVQIEPNTGRRMDGRPG